MHYNTIFLLFLLYCQCFYSKMKLFCQCTETHKVLLNDFFLPSIKDDFDITIAYHKQKSLSGEFLSPGFNKTMQDKTKWIIKLIKKHWKEVFIFSDVDIQFFKPCEKIINEYMLNKDVLFQKAYKNKICTGFFIVRANDTTLRLWNQTLDILKKDERKYDQAVLETLLNQIPGLRHGLLPDCFWNKGILDPTIWKPGMKLYVPKNIVMHHACYSIGIANKIQQLQEVKKKIYN